MLRTLFLIGVWHIKRKRRAQLRWVYNLLGGSVWQYNLWRSGCCIGFVFIGTVSRAQLWTSIKTCNFVTFYEFLLHLGVHHTGNEWMYLICRLFWWPWQCTGVIRSASPDAVCSGLYQKPLDAAIGWLLAPYCPSICQGNSKWYNDENIQQLCWPFWWLWQCAGTLLHTLPNGGGPGQGFTRSHWMPPLGKYYVQ